MKRFRALLLLFAVFALGGCTDDEITDPGPIHDNYVHVPAEAVTIQDALDSAGVGDTVLVAPGVYTGKGNRDILFPERRIIVLSVAGPESTIINCGGSEVEPHFGFDLVRAPAGVAIRGFTIQGGVASQGAAINVHDCNPSISDCIFMENVASVSGGAIRCKGSSPRIKNCTFVGNSSPFGAAVHLMAGSQPVVENCIFVGNGGIPFGANASSDLPSLSCSNIYGNSGGNWVGNIESQFGTRNNFSADPQFCGPENYHLNIGSPCAPSNSPCGELVGALEATCDQ